jgi:hypothetical protein
MICAQNAFRLLSLDKQEERMPDTLLMTGLRISPHEKTVISQYHHIHSLDYYMALLYP